MRIQKLLSLLFSLFLPLLSLSVSMQAQRFSEWSAPVNLGAVINSPYTDQCVSLSKNGLSLYFSSNNDTGSPQRDLYVSKRASKSEPWGAPQAVPSVNSVYDESCPALSLDEHRIYFVSNKPGGCGGPDIYVSRRLDRQDDLGWQLPENLGCASDGFVNTPGMEQTPYFFEDETGAVVMYFTTGMNSASYDIYASKQTVDGAFGPGTLVSELSTPYMELGAAVRRDGLEIVFCSSRPGGMGNLDLWTATRASTADLWSEPINLTVLNSSANEIGRLAFSFDGTELYFASDRPGGYGWRDIYFTTREKLRQPK